MYRGFNINANWNASTFAKYIIIGNNFYETTKSQTIKTLEAFVINNGVIDGSKLQSTWFPQINADIFISHSHDDLENVIGFAGFLYDCFGIQSFIDSCIWGHSSKLLKLIDDVYCINNSGSTYDYNKRNYSTSHIHMMLSTALNMMIDKTECLFFFNTPSSISSSEVVNNTKSPWIYSEISTSNTIRKTIPKRRSIERSKYFSKSETLNEDLKIHYEVNLSDLNKVDLYTIIKWLENFGKMNSSKNPHIALDILYDIFPIKF
jgi:hypothetical protein